MPDRVIAQRYRLLSQLGQGGMGSVWLAEHIELGTRVAVKLMEPTLAANPEGLGRFKREAQAAANLDSPNIVRVFDYGVDNGNPYIAMELLKGESLAERLTRVGRIAPSALANIYLQVGKAITKAHDAGIVHRDLKPDNIFLVADDEGDVAKVIDFGIAKRTSLAPGHLSAVATQTGAMLGTPYYMSPEQASGSKHIDYRTDIWSLGVIAFECLTGKRPYDSDSLGGLVLSICTGTPAVPSNIAAVPAGFDQWFARCAAREPAERYQSAREAASALCAICTSSDVVPIVDRVSKPLAVSGNAVEASTQPQDDAPRANQRAQSTHAGAVALTIPGLRKPPHYRRLVVYVGLGSVLIGAVAAGAALARRDATASLEVMQPTASPSIAARAEPTSAAVAAPLVSVAPAPSVTASTVVVEPVAKAVPAPAARSFTKPKPNAVANAPAPPAAAAPIDKPAAPAVAAPPKPTNPFATRQ